MENLPSSWMKTTLSIWKETTQKEEKERIKQRKIDYIFLSLETIFLIPREKLSRLKWLIETKA